eukprot:s7391_g1.t1
MDKDATASGRPAKLQKLHDLRRGVPYVSKSALEGILKTIQESVGAEGADKGQGVTVKAELVGGNAREHAATSLASSSKLAMKMCPSVWAGASTTGIDEKEEEQLLAKVPPGDVEDELLGCI